MSPTPAPLPRRTVAFLFDQLAVLALVIPPVLATGVSIGELVSPGRVRTIVFLILCGVAFVYHFIFEWLTARTPGKYLFGLRVVSDDGSAIGVWKSFLRNALRGIDGLIYWAVAVTIILVRGDGKRLGDVVGRTLVVADD